MPDERSVFRCPPLHARISERQCQINKQDALRGPPKGKGYRSNKRDRAWAVISVCKECPGVKALEATQ